MSAFILTSEKSKQTNRRMMRKVGEEGMSMKKLMFVVVLIVSIFGLAFTSHASLDPINVSSFQNIDWTKSLTGEIYYKFPSNSSSLLYSYCIDRATSMTVPGNYYAEKVPITGQMDGLLKAAYLMDTFAYSKNGAYGTWNGYNYNAQETGTAVQLAIWDVIKQGISPVTGYQYLFNLADQMKSTIPTGDLSSYASKYSVLDIYQNSNKTGGLQNVLTPNPVPIPPTAWLMGAGLFGVGFVRKRVRKS